MKKRILAWATVLMVAVSLTACGSSGITGSAAGTVGSPDNNTYQATAETADGNGSVENALTENRKIVYTADITMETETFDNTCSKLDAALEKAAGYASSISISGSSTRTAYFTYRVPVKAYQTFLKEIAGAGNVYSQSEQAEDITSQYVDVEARLKSLKTQLARLEELSAQAVDVDTLLSIESQISEVQYQIESYTAQQRTYDNQVEYTTIELTVEEVVKVTEGTTGFGSRVLAAFVGSWSSFISGLQGFIIALIYALPMLLILALIIFIIVWFSRRHAAKHPRVAPMPPMQQTTSAARYTAPIYAAPAAEKPAQTNDKETK